MNERTNESHSRAFVCVAERRKARLPNGTSSRPAWFHAAKLVAFNCVSGIRMCKSSLHCLNSVRKVPFQLLAASELRSMMMMMMIVVVVRSFVRHSNKLQAKCSLFVD